MERYPEWLLGTVTVAITVAICVVVAEVVLRFLPVASSLYTVPVTAQSPVFHFTPNRDFVYSRDWDMVLANRGHVNNAGFVNDQHYQKDGSLPMLAVVGDSMIEAAMVPYRDTLHGRLATALAGKLRVYSFATAGAPLSQYLIWARHAVREYGAEALVINVVGNDFHESHSAYKTSPGFWHYVPDANGELQLRLFEYRPGRLRDVVVASALARYLLFNMQVGLHWIELKSLLFGRPAMAAPLDAASNLDTSACATRWRQSTPSSATCPPMPVCLPRAFYSWWTDFVIPMQPRLTPEATQIACDEPYWRRPCRSATTPSTSIRSSLNVIGAPANVSSSRATATGALSAMAQLSMR